MAKYKIVGIPKFPGGGEVELRDYPGNKFKKDNSGNWIYSDGAPVRDAMILQKLNAGMGQPVGSSGVQSIYSKPDIRTGAMKVQAASQGPPTRANAAALKTATEQKKKEDAALALQQKLDAEAKRKLEEEQAFAIANPNAFQSETIQGTLAQLAPTTDEQWGHVAAAKQAYYNTRGSLAEIALDEHYDNVVYEVARDIRKDNPKLSFEESLAKAKEDYEILKKKALNLYVTQDPDVLARVAKEHGLYSPQKAGNTTMQQLNLNDPNHVSFENPNSAEGYYNRARSILLNPLDAFHYAMSPTETMPYNYEAYEDMKAKTGYQDGADKNAVMGAIDFASWWHPVGIYAQGMKMLPETVESTQKFVDDPSWANAGTAAFDIGMNALTLAGGKNPLVALSEEANAYRMAMTENDILRSSYGEFGQAGPMRPNPGNTGTGLLPVGSTSSTGSPLAKTVRTIDTRVPLYRVEPPNQSFSKNPLAAEYHDYELGAVSELTPEQLQSPNVKTYLNSGELYNPMYPEGTEMAGIFFPQETAGKWWTNQPFGTEGEVGIVAGQRGDVNNLLTTNVPFSKLQGYNVSNNPAALEFAGQPQKEFILPDEYRTAATVEPYPTKKPLNIEEELAKSEVLGFDKANAPIKYMLDDMGPNYSAQENETIAEVLDTIRAEKLEQWKTPEGQRRLQNLIDNTPALQGQTPETFVQGLNDLKNVNVFYKNEKEVNDALNEDYDQLEIALNEGKISKTEYQDQADELDALLMESDNLIAKAEGMLGGHAAFYSTSGNAIGIRPGAFKPEDLRVVGSHEFGHKINSYGAKELGPSYLDNQLAKLDLVTPTAEQLTIPGLQEEGKGIYGLMTPGKNYVGKSVDYFLNQSKGTEKVPFLMEIREDLLQQGIIKNAYDKITPKMLKDRYKDYRKTTGEKFPLRLYDIVKDKPQNFNIMSKVINNLPAVLSAVGMADAFLDEENPNVNEAGLSLLIGAIGKGKRGLKNVSKKTAKAITFRDKSLRKLADQANQMSRSAYTGYMNETQKAIGVSNKYLGEVAKVKNILPNALERKVVSTEELMANYQKQKEIETLEKNIPNIKVTDEGLKVEKKSPLSDVTTKGVGQITSFKTGKPVQASVEMPSSVMTIVPKNKKLEYIYEGNSNPVVSKEYLTTLNDNITHVEQLTGGKVYGSAVGVTQGGLPHLTGDIDVLILDSEYNRNVKNSLPQLADKGPAKVHNIGVKGEQGNIDFNIIHTNPNGTVKVTWSPYLNELTKEKRSLELELFRQFFPDEYYAEQKKAIQRLGNRLKDKKTSLMGINFSDSSLIDPEALGLEINISAKEFMDKIDPAVKTIVDAYESSKHKHINRIDTYINYGNPSVVKKGQETYVKSLVGSKGSIGPQLSAEALSNVETNREALRAMDFIGDIESVAANPEKMQLALNDFYINNSIYNRQVSNKGSIQDLENSFKKWDITQGGGSLHGFGLNTVKLGDPIHSGIILGQMQYGLEVNAANPLEYVNSVKFATSGGGTFTPEQKEIVKDIIKYHSGIYYDEAVMSQINKTGDLLSNRILQDLAASPASKKNIQKIYNEITKKLGARTASMADGDRYGTSYYSSILGDFDEAKDLLQYSILNTALKPKSLLTRQSNFQNLVNGMPAGQIDSNLIKTFEDYKKIENAINGGLEKAKARSEQFQELIRKLDKQLDEKAERIATKKNPELKKEYDKAKEQIEHYRQQVNKYNELEREYLKQANEIKNFRQLIIPVLLGAGTLGFTGQVIYNRFSEEAKPKDQIDSYFQTDELSKKEKAYVNKYFKSKGSLKGFTWPDGTGVQSHNTVGEGMLMENPHLKPPTKRFKKGGVIELELTPKQIQEYVAKGYIVEEQ